MARARTDHPGKIKTKAVFSQRNPSCCNFKSQGIFVFFGGGELPRILALLVSVQFLVCDLKNVRLKLLGQRNSKIL